MIRLTLGTLVFVGLAVMLGGIFAAWILSEWRRQRRERRSFEHVYRCATCGCEFEDSTDESLARCPRCDSLNERYRVSRL